MRLLHVSDLHLGRALGDLSREREQRAVVREIVLLAKEHGVSMTVIAGDVFDAFTPPAWAEDLFFELLDGLARGGERAVAVIAGNHDSAVRLSAADPLARRLGILLAGDIDEPLMGFDGTSSAVRVRMLAHHVARVEVPSAEAPIVVGLLPFLSEARVSRENEAPSLRYTLAPKRYAERLEREIAARTEPRDPDAVQLLVMHQLVTGGQTSESERRLRAFALSDVDPSAIPEGLGYVALGHLHRPQQVTGAFSPAHYAGSPLSYSFSEAGQQKRVVLLDMEPGKEAVVTSVPLSSGRPLEVWSVGSIEEAAQKAASRSDQPIIDLRVDLGRALAPTDHDVLFATPGVNVHAVRDLFLARKSPNARMDQERVDMGPPELFKELWQRRFGEEPDAETMEELGSALVEVGRRSDEE